MMAGDVYDYSGRTRADLIICGLFMMPNIGKGGPNGDYQSPTGANHVKHLYGNNNDHVLGLGVSAGNMCYGLATHIPRLSDIYLVYAEAKMGLATSTTDQSALDAFNAVRGRAIRELLRKPPLLGRTSGRNASWNWLAKATVGMIMYVWHIMIPSVLSMS